eukprot:4205958-Amphidinium_carterae.1
MLTRLAGGYVPAVKSKGEIDIDRIMDPVVILIAAKMQHTVPDKNITIRFVFGLEVFPTN